MFLITETLSFVHFFSSKKTKSVERHKKLLVQLSICSTSSQKSIFSKLADICNKNVNKGKQKNLEILENASPFLVHNYQRIHQFLTKLWLNVGTKIMRKS